MKAIILGAGLLLMGCVDPFVQLSSEVGWFQGQDIHTLINRLGYPESQAVIAGDTVYTWGTSTHQEFDLPTTQTTTGSVDGEPFYATTAGTETIHMNFACTLQAATSANGVILQIHWHGNRGGCSRYANALRQ